MPTCLEQCLGGCIGSCISCIIYLQDKYTDWRWNRDGEPVFTGDIPIMQPPLVDKSIHTAVIDRNPTEVVKILNAKPESSTEVNSGSETPLHLACKLGYLDVMEALLENGSPCITTSIGSPIHCVLHAVKTGYVTTEPVIEAIKMLASKGCNLDARDRGQKTALFLAAEQGNYKCIETLIELGSSVNLQDSNRFSPLYMSVIRGDLKCVNLLICHLPKMSDVDSEDTSGRTPLIAALLTIINNLKYEKMPNDQFSALNNTSSEDDVDLDRYNRVAVVETLLKSGADPNARDSLDRSALVIAFIILELDYVHMTNTSSSTSDVQRHTYSNRLIQGTEMNVERNAMESIYTPLVRLLVLSGARLPHSWQKDYSKSPEWLKQLYDESHRAWTEQKVQKPPLLIHLSRVAIRAHLARVKRLHHVQMLPIPEKLIGYVSVKYL